MSEKIGFPPYQGLPFDYRAPVIDGLCEWEVGVPDPLIESGWVGATRLTYGGASGIPVMSFQALKDNASNGFIYLSFVVRLDVAFDDNDGIIIVFQPTYNGAAHDANTRRLLIRPNYNPVGAGAGDAVKNSAPDLTVTVPAMGGGTVSIPIRTNHLTTRTWSKWNAGAWTDMAEPTNFDIKARSWTISGSDLDWSVELKLPATIAQGGADWITLNPASFGFYFNVLRFSTLPTVLNFANVTEFSWPRGHVISDSDPDGPYASLGDIMIPPSKMGEAVLGSGGEGVYFDGGWDSIGVESGGVVTGSVDATLNTVNTLVAKLKNDSTTVDALGVNATFRIADFGIGPGGNADWAKIDPIASGTAGPNNTNPTARVTVPKNNVATKLSMDWKIDTGVRTTFFGHGSDQCLLVELDSDQNANFKENSYRRNLSFANLSSVKRQVVVSGKGHGTPPPGQSEHEFLLITSHRLLSSSIAYDGWIPETGRPPKGDNPNVGAANLALKKGSNQQAGQTAPVLANEIFNRWNPRGEVNYTWLAITAAFRRTAQTLTLGGKSYPIYDIADSYNHALFHVGEVSGWNYSVNGPNLHRIANGIHRLKVPDGGKAVLDVEYEAVPVGNFWGKKWFWILLLIILILLAVKLFK